jgi:hypothetical protein
MIVLWQPLLPIQDMPSATLMAPRYPAAGWLLPTTTKIHLTHTAPRRSPADKTRFMSGWPPPWPAKAPGLRALKECSQPVQGGAQ